MNEITVWMQAYVAWMREFNALEFDDVKDEFLETEPEMPEVVKAVLSYDARNVIETMEAYLKTVA